eukprot:gene5871-5940_t
MADKKIKLPRKRIRKLMRGPLFWIVLALVLVVALGKVSGSGATYTPVDTSTIINEISANKVESALVIDKDQKIEVILKSGESVNGATHLVASYVANEEQQITELLISNPPSKAWNAILEVHAKGKPIAKSVDLGEIAKRTPGFTGADLANVLNEAALLTARENAKVITTMALDESIDRVMAGPQRTSRLMTEEERRITAYHEGGHALVAHALPNTDPVHKITIMPRGRALGYTMVLPDEDRYATTRNQMLDQLSYSLGGRAAEELIFHDPTTGASNDIEKATNLARAMVTQYGMTERIGAIKLGTGDSDPFLGRDYGHQRDYSEEIAGIIDEEIHALIENAHQEAFNILVANRDILDALVVELLERETLLKDDIERIFAKVALVEPRPAWTGSPNRTPSTIPPVGLVAAKPQVDPEANPAKPTRKPRKKVAPPVPEQIARAEFDQARAERAITELLLAIGEDPTRDGLRDTPARVARAYRENFEGLWQNPEDILTTTFDIGHKELVIVRDIEVFSHCEHHLTPFHGVAHVGYIPGESGRITGISKLARLVDLYSRRPQVQERLTTQIADAIVEILKPAGVIVIIDCEHLCMSMRGVKKSQARTTTSAVRGHLRNAATRAEAMALITASDR